MHGWSHNPVTERQSPSFSSSLLDEIYRSMDAGDDNPCEFKLREDKVSRKQSVGGGNVAEDREILSLRRAFLVQKWMDVRTSANNLAIRTRPSSIPVRIDDDPLFFGSVSSSSGSSSEYVSEPIGYCESGSQKPSCFGPFRSKARKDNQQMNSDYCLHNNHMSNIFHGPLINSKARALKIYSNLKKVKQPISPGGRLTRFLNSLLTNRHLKKPKVLNEQNIERKSKSTHGSTCSSTPFTKSCLRKNSPRSRKKLSNGMQRTVRFCPVCVIIDEDCRPCGEKYIYAEQDFMSVNATKMMSRNQYNNDDEENDYIDTTSDASSDLFELDHLSTLQECQELLVFKTTHFDTKCANANRLIW